MPRSIWNGVVSFGMVSIPVKLYTATDNKDISFNQLHKTCGTRIKQQRWCPTDEKVLEMGDIVRGYEYARDQYVVLTEEDFEKVRPESTRIIDLVQFADESAIDPIYVDRAYYLAPDGPVAADAFAVVRDGMKGKVGVGKVALYGREYLVAVRPQQRGLVMYTLHHAGEIRSIDAVDELGSVPSTVKPEEIKLARQVIETFDAPLDLSAYKDEYRAGLQAIIDAKIAGEEIVAPTVEAPPRVVNLMEALKKSLDAVSVQKKRPARAAARTSVAPKRRRA